MIAGVLWRLVLIAIAIVTIGIQLDRQTQRSPALAQQVPEMFRSSAQFPVAAYALAENNPERALEEAERLVRRRPLPAEHLRALAQAQIAAQDTEAGTLTIQYAAQRGWRDPVAQEVMLRLAIDAGDNDEAARRYAALFLRRDTQDALLEELGEPVLAEEGGLGRQTLISIVGGGERWHSQFLNRGARVMLPDAFVEIVGATIEAGTRYDCDVMERAINVLGQRDERSGTQLAEIAQKQGCPPIPTDP